MQTGKRRLSSHASSGTTAAAKESAASGRDPRRVLGAIKQARPGLLFLPFARHALSKAPARCIGFGRFDYARHIGHNRPTRFFVKDPRIGPVQRNRTRDGVPATNPPLAQTSGSEVDVCHGRRQPFGTDRQMLMPIVLFYRRLAFRC